MRVLLVGLALCVAGCQFAIGGVPPAPGAPSAGDPVGQPQPQAALDGGAAMDALAATDGGSVTPPPPSNPPPGMPTPTDCRTTGCVQGDICLFLHKQGFICVPPGGD